MKKYVALCLCLLLAAAAFGCAAKTPPVSDTLSGSLTDLMASIRSGADALLDDESRLPMSFDSAADSENCQGMLGLTPDQLEKYAEDAVVSTAAIGSHAYELALVKCKDAASAAEVKKLIAAGFDSGKWICVFPDQSFVIDSGSYVLLAATTADAADALQQSFRSLAGELVGEVKVFYTKSA
ncbi:MAG: DUF4358 domain-containing protein [Oscillospiraceae bacterium]|jgi:hypothetical protein|nr:DUF4358 domain-containing protein [Oscillospiraceae bacterium]